MSVFPNPATDFINVKGLSAINGSNVVVVSSVTGIEISCQVVTGDAAHIATGALPASIYMLQVQTEAGNGA